MNRSLRERDMNILHHPAIHLMAYIYSPSRIGYCMQYILTFLIEARMENLIGKLSARQKTKGDNHEYRTLVE